MRALTTFDGGSYCPDSINLPPEKSTFLAKLKSQLISGIVALREMKATQTILDAIMVDVRRELAQAQARRPLQELRRMTADALPVRSFKGALQKSFGIIAEIKECSPSHGAMRRENI